MATFPLDKEVKKDINEIYEIKNKLKELQKHHALILYSAGEGIYGLDTKGHTTFVNRAAQEMVGYKLEELLNKNQHNVIHHSKSDGSVFHAHECKIYAAFKDGKVYQSDDEVFWRKDGTCFPVEYTSTPIKNDSSALIGAVVVFKDITQRKKSEEEITKANNELKLALSEVEKLKLKLEEENKYLQHEIKLTFNFEEIISQSKKFRRELAKVEQVSSTDATVLIMGESGTGKELIARAVHNISNRKNSPMVKVNCAALPATLIESELFGHEKGAFTGALQRKIGRFELANNGTLFLDEIGELPFELQSKLLRVLQEGEFERLGTTKTLKVNVRIIAATNKNLETEVIAGKFREDLYYRLNVFPIIVPPLREREDDVELLAHHFILKHGTKLGKKIKIVPEKVINSLIKYSWPGNVRELENVIERALIITSGTKLDLGDWLPNEIKNETNNKLLTLEESESIAILKALKSTNWKISGEKGAAKLLDIKRTTLESRMKKLNIQRPQ